MKTLCVIFAAALVAIPSAFAGEGKSTAAAAGQCNATKSACCPAGKKVAKAVKSAHAIKGATLLVSR